jgi:hypothetical protein
MTIAKTKTKAVAKTVYHQWPSLRQRKQWGLWRWWTRPGTGKPTKLPCDAAKATQKPDNASSTDPSTWSSYQKACDELAAYHELYDGLVYFFDENDPFCGLDLDKCLLKKNDITSAKAWVKPILLMFADCYAEFSPSGMGIHIWCVGKLAGKGRKIEFQIDGVKCAVEAYSRARPFCVTNRRCIGAPDDLKPHQPEIEAALAIAEKLAQEHPLPPQGAKAAAKGAGGGKADGKKQAAKFVGGVAAAETGRHDTMMSITGTLYAAHVKAPLIRDLMLAYNETYCNPPKSAKEVCEMLQYLEDNAATAVLEDAVQWPRRLGKDAYHGLAGDFVRAVQPHTESDPAAVLLQFLVMFGNNIGRTAHWITDDTHHYLNLFLALVGPTSRARKGTGYNRAVRPYRDIDPVWFTKCKRSGLKTGEGITHAVRDARYKLDPEGNPVVGDDGNPIVLDPGVADKRLLAVESELSRVLKAGDREGNILIDTLQQAWDGENLGDMTKHNDEYATGPHISMIGHTTRELLAMTLSQANCVGGFGNRELWACVKRSRILPRGGKPLDPQLQKDLNAKIRQALIKAKKVGEMGMTKEAWALWEGKKGKDGKYKGGKYAELTADRPGILGAVTSRGEAQVRRLACIYALLDGKSNVWQVHLKAALEVWRFVFDSARFLFSKAASDPLGAAILKGLREAGAKGLAQSKILSLFGRNKSAAEIYAKLAELQRQGMIRSRKDEPQGVGRPALRWFLV